MNADLPVTQPSSSRPESPEKRTNISVLFIGYSRERAAQIQASLQANCMTPRCRHIADEVEYISSLSERSWDIVLLCDSHLQDISFARAAEIVKNLDKDIPLILLCDELPDSETHLALLEMGISIACTAGNEKLNLLYIYQAYSALLQRQQWRYNESLLEKAERRIQTLINDSRTAICFTRHNNVTYGNKCFYELLGYDQPDQNIEQLSFDQLVAPAQRELLQHHINQVISGELPSTTLNIEMIRMDTSRIQTSLTLYLTVHAQNEVLQIDINQNSIEIAKDLDPATGLLNRNGFTQHLENALAQARQGGHDGFLFFLDMDHSNEDQEEQDLFAGSIADVLTSLVEETHTISRLNNTQFAFILPNSNTEAATRLTKTLCQHLAALELTPSDNTTNRIGSIGIAMISESAPRVTELLNRAQMATRNPSQNELHGVSYSFYQLDNQPLLAADTSAVQRILDAITHNRFRLLFQPIVLLDTETHTGSYEVLLRLITDDNQEESPNLFMNNISDDEVLARMDMWVLEESTRSMRQALDQSQRNRLFINVTGRTLRNKSLLPWFSEQLRSLRLPADHFVFEISEVDALASPAYYKAFCSALHKLQCKICLKHYGSTSESHYVLTDAKVDFIKLDGSYMNDLKQNSVNIREIEKIIMPLREKKLTIIAPMVEDTRQMSTLFRLGVQMVQGHYLQPPRHEMDYAFFDE